MGELVLASVADAAAALEHAAGQIAAGEVGMVLAIAAMCDLHTVDESTLVEGAERWVPGGADGTPRIGEFVAGEVAGLLGVSIGAAFDRIALVLNLRHRHPTLWQAFVAGDVRWWDAARAARAAAQAGLDAGACERFDRLCAHALALQPWARVRGQVERWLLLADPAAAAVREQRARQSRHVTLGEITDGHTRLWGQLDAADGLALDDALTLLADTLDDGDQQQRRATALGLLARTALGQDALPALPTATPDAPARRPAELVVHVRAADLLDPEAGVASLDRWGHVLLPRLRQLLAGCGVTVRPLLAGAAPAGVDGYGVPTTLWHALVARDPVDVFPYGVRNSRACQVDHTRPYDGRAPAGARQTSWGNLGPLSTFTHRLKTHGGWRLEQPEPGHFVWRSPLGYEYAVTADGTLRTGRPRAAPHAWWLQEPPPLAEAA